MGNKKAMLSEPTIEFRESLSYVAIRATVKQLEIPQVLPPLIPEILQWVQRQNLQQEGPVFFRYLSNNKGVMDVEVGVPVRDSIPAGDRVVSGSYPAGKYLVAKHTGPYTQLYSAHMSLEEYLEKNGLREKGVQDNGDLCGTRSEFYITDPAEVPDPSKWETELVMMVE